MRIVIDLQGAQTESRLLGIGRYTLSFARAVVRNRGQHEVILALNGMFPETIEPIRGIFDGILPQENIRVWYAASLAGESSMDQKALRSASELIREAFLASLQPDLIHISSLFEGRDDDATTSINLFDKKTPVSVTLYDPVPSANAHHFFEQSDSHAEFYNSKRASLNEARMAIAISDHVQQQTAGNLSLAPDCLVNASKPTKLDTIAGKANENATKSLRNRIGSNRPFVLFKSGANAHTDMLHLVEAWSALPSKLRSTHQLLLAGEISLAQRIDLSEANKSLGLEPEELEVLEQLTDRELPELMKLCKLVVCPSSENDRTALVEAAVSCGAPIICPDSDEGPQKPALEDAEFSTHNVASLTNLLSRALGDGAFLRQMRIHSATQANSFSWNGLAKGALVAWENYLGEASAAKNEWEAVPPSIKLVNALAPLLVTVNDALVEALASSISKNESAGLQRQLLLNVSTLCECDEGIGSQPTVDSCIRMLLEHPPIGFRVELVYSGASDGYRYASQFTTRILGLHDVATTDHPMRWSKGDVFFDLGQQPSEQMERRLFYAQLRRDGVDVKFLLHSAAPLQDGQGPTSDVEAEWVQLLAEQTGVICSSTSIADALFASFKRHGIEKAPGFCSTLLPAKDTAATSPGSRKPSALGTRDTYLVEAGNTETETIAQNLRLALTEQSHRRHQLLVDASHLVIDDARTGIQRVVRSILCEWLSNPPDGYRVEPGYATTNEPYRYARRYGSSLRGLVPEGPDDVVDVAPGDVFLGLDLQHIVVPAKKSTLQEWRQQGVQVWFAVYDLLPITMPECFLPTVKDHHQTWLETICEFDGALCISKAVADELKEWMGEFLPVRHRPFSVKWFHLGADIEASAPTQGIPEDGARVLQTIAARPSFLMVSTIEPRKGHEQVLDAFEQLWDSGFDANLVIVGKQGWHVEALINRLRTHPETGERLLWLEGVSDEFLGQIYSASTCLIVASRGEGFGLPLIESAQHKLPIIVRDLRVFREVADDHAFYFSGKNAEDLADAIRNWNALYKHQLQPKPEGMHQQSWKESAAQISSRIKLRTPSKSTYTQSKPRKIQSSAQNALVQIAN